jgi:hypothetical protein
MSHFHAKTTAFLDEGAGAQRASTRPCVFHQQRRPLVWLRSPRHRPSHLAALFWRYSQVRQRRMLQETAGRIPARGPMPEKIQRARRRVSRKKRTHPPQPAPPHPVLPHSVPVPPHSVMVAAVQLRRLHPQSQPRLLRLLSHRRLQLTFARADRQTVNGIATD